MEGLYLKHAADRRVGRYKYVRHDFFNGGLFGTVTGWIGRSSPIKGVE